MILNPKNENKKQETSKLEHANNKNTHQKRCEKKNLCDLWKVELIWASPKIGGKKWVIESPGVFYPKRKASKKKSQKLCKHASSLKKHPWQEKGERTFQADPGQSMIVHNEPHEPSPEQKAEKPCSIRRFQVYWLHFGEQDNVGRSEKLYGQKEKVKKVVCLRHEVSLDLLYDFGNLWYGMFAFSLVYIVC